MYIHADLACRLPRMPGHPDSDLSWPLALDPVQIGELLEIQGVFGTLVPLESYALVRIRQPLLLETVLQSRLRRAPYFGMLVEKLRTDPEKSSEWALRLTPLELVNQDEIVTQEREIPVLYETAELKAPLFSLEEIEAFLDEVAQKEKVS